MSDAEGGNEQPQVYALRVTERAQRDLDAATLHFVAVASEESAVVWREGIYNVISSLATSPRRCSPVPERFRRETRQILYRRPASQTVYRILFTIVGEEETTSDAPTVSILHIRSAAARFIPRAQMREIEAGE